MFFSFKFVKKGWGWGHKKYFIEYDSLYLMQWFNPITIFKGKQVIYKLHFQCMMVMLNALWNLNTPNLIMLCVSKIKKYFLQQNIFFYSFWGNLLHVVSF